MYDLDARDTLFILSVDSVFLVKQRTITNYQHFYSWEKSKLVSFSHKMLIYLSIIEVIYIFHRCKSDDMNVLG